MPQLDFDGANSKISADKIQGQSGTTVTIPAGHNLAGDGSGLTNLPASAVQCKVGEFNYVVNTASGTQVITGVGFQPTGLWIFAGPDRGTSPPPVFGATDGTTHGNVASIHPTASSLWDANTANLIDIETSAGNSAVAVLTSFDVGGFTLTWTKSGTPPTQTILINYMAWR